MNIWLLAIPAIVAGVVFVSATIGNATANSSASGSNSVSAGEASGAPGSRGTDQQEERRAAAEVRKAQKEANNTQTITIPIETATPTTTQGVTVSPYIAPIVSSPITHELPTYIQPSPVLIPTYLDPISGNDAVPNATGGVGTPP